MITPELLPIRGGVGSYSVEIAKRMPAHVEMHILTPRPREAILADSISEGEQFPDNVQLHYSGSRDYEFFGNFLFQLTCKINLRRIVRELDIDIVHSHSVMPDYLVKPSELEVSLM